MEGFPEGLHSSLLIICWEPDRIFKRKDMKYNDAEMGIYMEKERMSGDYHVVSVHAYGMQWESDTQKADGVYVKEYV